MKISVIGAGNGGQAIAGYLASLGNEVTLCEHNAIRAEELNKNKTIRLRGKINVVGTLSKVVTNAAEAIKGAQLVMIVTTASAHANLARQIAHSIEDDQIIILNPGRTGGALEFKNILSLCGTTVRYYLAEAQTLIYACRLIKNGEVNIIGIKDKVLLSGLPASDTSHILSVINQYYPCFVSCQNVLVTSLENYGAVFHPSVVLFNAAAIERGSSFYFYREMTPQIAEFIEQLDEERCAVGNAYGIKLTSAKDWVKEAYKGIEGDTLCERMQNNPAYYDILAPTTINCRQLTEDIPTGAVPLVSLGRVAGLNMPIYSGIINIISALLKTDFYNQGRNLHNLGLENLSKEEIIQKLS